MYEENQNWKGKVRNFGNTELFFHINKGPSKVCLLLKGEIILRVCVDCIYIFICYIWLELIGNLVQNDDVLKLASFNIDFCKVGSIYNGERVTLLQLFVVVAKDENVSL